MNTNPSAIKILCYGDSNTWGRDPKEKGSRYPATVRWTGLLQKKLGDKYEIVEEGLSGRTTVLDQDEREGKNGKTYLKPCLETHNPLDIVILFLGTNDLKEQFHQSPQDIVSNIEVLVHMIKEFAWSKERKSPRIILVSPPFVDESVPGTQKDYKGAEEKSKQLGSLYQKVAEQNGCEVIDSAKIVAPSKSDGYHLDPEAHAKISDVLESKIQEMTNHE